MSAIWELDGLKARPLVRFETRGDIYAGSSVRVMLVLQAEAASPGSTAWLETFGALRVHATVALHEIVPSVPAGMVCARHFSSNRGQPPSVEYAIQIQLPRCGLRAQVCPPPPLPAWQP